MCYLIAKKFNEQGCIAVKTKYGKGLADFVEELNDKVSEKEIQLVTVSRPSAYGEYDPYEMIGNMEEFRERVLSMAAE